MRVHNNQSHKRFGLSLPDSTAALSKLLALLLILLVSAVLALFLGAAKIPPSEIWESLKTGSKEAVSYAVFVHARLPRTLAAILCGSALAVSGTLLQALLNNALAGPNIIGVNAGAGFGALLVTALLPMQALWLPTAAFLGALAASLLIFAVARKTGASRSTILLAGLALSGILSAASGCIKTFVPDVVAAYNSFSLGSLNGVTLRQLLPALCYMLSAFLTAAILARSMNVLLLGEDLARSLGLRLRLCRFLLIITASVLAGAAVSIAGLLGFVGVLAPHAARRLVGNNHSVLLPAAALLGAISVLLCDLIGRVLFAPFELPVGIVLSLIGGIGFVILLLKQKGGRVRD